MSQYLGDISAYALAVSQGYTGTEEEYAELMASYATVGQTAVTAAQTATTKASEAATSATTATNKASEATTAATTATTKAGEASTSASTATSAKDTAVSASQAATSKATEATTAAATATSAATTATTAKDDAVNAKTAAQTAQTGAETAAASVEASAAQIATNAADISQLKSDLSKIAEPTSNRFDTSKITANQYITQDGTATASQNFSVTDYIPVSEGEQLYFRSRRTDNAFYAFDARFLCAYDANKTAVSASGGAFVGGTYTVPSGIAYIRLSISNTYLSTYTDFYIGTVNANTTNYVPYGYEVKIPAVITDQIDENTANIAQNTADIATTENTLENLTEPTSNLLNTDTITAGKYITADGTITDIATLSLTDYIHVVAGETLYYWALVNGTYQAVPMRTRCCFDADKNPVPSEGYNSETQQPYTVGNDVAYIRYSISNTVLEYENLYIGTHEVGVDYEPYGRKIKTENSADDSYTVSNGGSILEGLIYCYGNNIKKLIVESGTYDVIAEYESKYGSDYFTNYANYATSNPFDRGLWLENIEVVFSAGAKVVCKYTGDNANVPLYFSAFATGNNVTIDGLVLDAENLHYGIHADYNSGADETFFYVRNCDLKHYKNATSMQAIGAGLGKHVFWLFENTIFRSAGGNDKVLRIHNNVNSDAQSKIIVKDCYIDGDGYFKFNAYSTSELQTIIQVCGCSFKTAPVVGKETSASNDNFTMYAWNNEIRSA
jgi:hypothetical protein